MVTFADWAKLLNFVGSAVLFYASYRNQDWAKTQATLEENAARRKNDSRNAQPNKSDATVSNADLAEAAAEVASRPYFDRGAYLLLCVGFGVTTIASFLDMYDAGTLGHLLQYVRNR
jgi:hypothetical protein